MLIFFAFFGWEAFTHLSAEFRDPRRDVPRSTLLAVFLIAVLLVGVAVATVGTGTYGAAAVNRTVVARLIADPLGTTAGWLAAAALLIALATVNAVIAATSRLGYALARDGAFPRAFHRLSRQLIPATSVIFIGCYACAAVGVSYPAGWGAEDLLVVPNSLIIMTYVAGTAAGVRLLAGVHRFLAALATALCAALLPFAGISLLIPAAVTIAALAYRRLLGRRSGHNRARPQGTASE